MKQTTILYVIDDLGRGGAETLLMGILPELTTRFNIVIVTLSDKYEFGPSDLDGCTTFSLGFTGKISLLPAISKLRKIIRSMKPDLVHAHLSHSSIVARVACPPSIPLLYSIHTIMSKDVFDNSFLYTLIERLTVKSRHQVMAVSQAALEDYRSIIKFSGKSYTLKNYVADAFLNRNEMLSYGIPGRPIRLVAVGNIKPVKNYAYLLNALTQVDGVSLDIYGNGDHTTVAGLQAEIDRRRLPIVLKGPAGNIAALLPAYDLFVMSSTYEGFGIAPVEAMALGLPVMLSDIPVFREITHGNALFFDLQQPASFAALIKEILEGRHDLGALSVRGMQIARTNYSKARYLENLYAIYDQII